MPRSSCPRSCRRTPRHPLPVSIAPRHRATIPARLFIPVRHPLHSGLFGSLDSGLFGSLDSGPASASSPAGSKCRMQRDGCGWCGPSVTPVTSRPAFRTRIGTAHGEGLQKDQRLAGMWQRRTFLHGYLTRLPRACWHRNDPNPTRRGIPRLRRRSRCACCLVLSPNLQSKPSVQTFGPNLRPKPWAQTFGPNVPG